MEGNGQASMVVPLLAADEPPEDDAVLVPPTPPALASGRGPAPPPVSERSGVAVWAVIRAMARSVAALDPLTKVHDASAVRQSGPLIGGPPRPALPVGDGSSLSPVACMCTLRGEALLHVESRARAVPWFLAALRIDPYAVTALTALIEHHLLSDDQEEALQSYLTQVRNVTQMKGSGMPPSGRGTMSQLYIPSQRLRSQAFGTAEATIMPTSVFAVRDVSSVTESGAVVNGAGLSQHLRSGWSLPPSVLSIQVKHNGEHVHASAASNNSNTFVAAEGAQRRELTGEPSRKREQDGILPASGTAHVSHVDVAASTVTSRRRGLAHNRPVSALPRSAPAVGTTTANLLTQVRALFDFACER